MRRLWQAFAAGAREEWRPFNRVMPTLLRSMAVSGLMVLAGVGVIALGKQITAPGGELMGVLGEGLLMGGAGYGIVAALRGWVALFQAAGYIGKS